MIVTAVLVAAGSGSRLGSDVPKAFVRVGGATLLEHAVGRFAAHPRVRDLVVAAPPELTASAAAAAEATAASTPAAIVAGGATRQQSVARALGAVGPDVDAVLVHDVARPFVPAEVIDRVLDALATADGAVPVLPVSDTIRRARGDGALGQLVDRDSLLAMQTPQGFRRDVLVRAHDAASEDATDDAALVQAIGGRVVGVPGDQRAFKITVPFDLVVAEAVAAAVATP